MAVAVNVTVCASPSIGEENVSVVGAAETSSASAVPPVSVTSTTMSSVGAVPLRLSTTSTVVVPPSATSPTPDEKATVAPSAMLAM